MAKKIKSNNLPGKVAARLFADINKKYVEFVEYDYKPSVLKCQIDPNDDRLVYPEGWYFGKGCFRNKHQSDSGIYEEFAIVGAAGGKQWQSECITPSEMEEITVLI